ncbi:MAG: cell division/cell wall cluster transcriptional repressor MraZ [Candidatus Harrisonbacteria bacterium CG10_big_fil_rev_8_21_14_0_10_40_38]|uniref:Transcriptional regulator MraZ n=1 Tax=Candidatus Harrisonbacteria bacterium CG10_big_fil_rev_8_21_14_0_10_40_38 TaxID=1974583 RepID=A0A2H0UT15_9BACT|nr:MAG: cell division/cell wall cluster transcriptional repressor MraZ [Candidatus Harrisonbacteria bacterium CG10_big_fil_rev_8_21_14_0_10_40_38]
MFIGEYTHNLDEKGRMALPVRFRKGLVDGAIVTRGLDKCLFVFDKREWEILAQKIVSLPLTHSNARSFSRFMLAGATEVDIDQQGRILIPEYLRKFASLKKQVVVAGLYTRIEIWDGEVWQEYKDKADLESDSIVEHMDNLGI